MAESPSLEYENALELAQWNIEIASSRRDSNDKEIFIQASQAYGLIALAIATKKMSDKLWAP